MCVPAYKAISRSAGCSSDEFRHRRASIEFVLACGDSTETSQLSGIALRRTQVGDKYVMEELLRNGFSLGGEQSGHIIFTDYLFTGDGLATSLGVLRVMAATGRPLSSLAAQLVTYPQVLVNVRVRERRDLASVPAVAHVIAGVESRLAGQGRLLVRYSGTEPLLRIMLEGRDRDEITSWANEIAGIVKQELA